MLNALLKKDSIASEILARLMMEDGVYTATEIADFYGEMTGRYTGTLNKLYERGLIGKSPTKDRASAYHLTEKGKHIHKVAQDARPHVKRVENALNASEEVIEEMSQ